MAELAALDMLGQQRFPEQRVVTQVEHPDRKVVAGPPIRVDQFNLPGRKTYGHDDPPPHAGGLEAEFQGLCFKLRPIAQRGQYGTATTNRCADLQRITRLIAIGEIGVARLKAYENPPKRNSAI
jgi:hypothetical protein